MSTSQLWAPQPQRPQAQSTADRLSSSPNMLPGTWLQLSPVTGSSLPSPVLKADASPVNLKDIDTRFLSNNTSASRHESFSSQGSVDPMRRPLVSSVNSPDIERREVAIRSGRIEAAFRE
ncbi:hypothetical protein CLAFUW4_09937 [Fulvia fulva]|uniref:Uncharacterized protein n=1 Tax=Passalora fulva TaxID=5499 RepID=A0A9Q8UUB9_PASFU|nr:uncharacterized protein CLAFUR5_12304 [Fulvia fulva]KAK4616034.1 hypothetical protein CLAFUR4_09941 [Fulvia fulva]KAK4616800.1 hypothetical protein CLAFUR0_09938 [Fulvia fulva]UJO22735.1 hypothetical protein CLAFUR5_12304 [Fulvia fulva]WPV19542.1 hypothetical protein CLAFUW4_09937 [Fulvia fulva]WPV34009.1 hypothetical protein CLAFUW7_09938 [Fulvia fulva]